MAKLHRDCRNAVCPIHAHKRLQKNYKSPPIHNLPNPRRCRRHLEVPHAVAFQGVVDRIHPRRQGADGAAFVALNTKQKTRTSLRRREYTRSGATPNATGTGNT